MSFTKVVCAASSLVMLSIGGAAMAAPVVVRQATANAVSGPEHRIFGIVSSIDGTSLSVRLRSGRTIRIDASDAFAKNQVSGPLFVAKQVVVKGRLDANGVVHATVVSKASPNVAAWAADR